MKTFKKLQSELAESSDIAVDGMKNVFIRGDKRGTSHISNSMVKSKPIGWFANKENNAFGFNIHALDSHDITWLKSKKVDLKNVFRSVTDKGTTIVKFDFKKGTVAFADNKHLEATDEFKFDRPSPFTRLFIDSGYEKEFGI